MRAPHEVLGIRDGATRAEIDEAYRRKLLYLNPNAFAEETPERKNAIEAYEEIKEAYTALTVPAVQHIPVTQESNRHLKPILIVCAVLIFPMVSILIMSARKGIENNPVPIHYIEADEKNTISKVAEKVMQSAVLIKVERTNGDLVYGSGFFVNNRGDILTNYHVIESASSILIMTNEQNHYDAKIKAFEVRADMALLSSSTPFTESKPLVITETLPSVGTEVVVVGSPKAEFQSVSNGIVAGVRDKGGITAIQITAPISSGSSGGPVVNMQSEVIGISTAIRADAQNLNFAVSSKHLASFVAYAEKMPPMPLAAKISQPKRQIPSNGLMPPAAPRAQEDTKRLPLPDEFGFMSHRWGCSVQDVRSRLPKLEFLSSNPPNGQSVSHYSTRIPFNAFDCNASVVVLYVFYQNRLCEVLFMTALPARAILRSRFSITGELTQIYGPPDVGDGAEPLYFWDKGEDTRVIIRDPYSERPICLVDFIYYPIWKDSWERNYEDYEDYDE